MTDKLRETLNLPELDEMLDQINTNADDSQQDIDEDEDELNAVRAGLSEISFNGEKEYSEDGMDELESEMDKVIEVGMSEFKDIIDYGYDIEAKNAAAVFAAAAKILEITVNASKIKQEQKLKIIKMKMDQERQDHEIAQSKGLVVKGQTIEKDNESDTQASGGRIINRANYLRELKDKQNNSENK